MNALRKKVIIYLLDNGKKDGIELKKIQNNIKISSEIFNNIINELEKKKLLQLNNDIVNFTLNQRIWLSYAALEAGADFQTVSRNLSWLEFEEFSALLFEENGFKVFRRFRFIAEDRRWEIDLLALRKPYVICSECKHWKKGMGNTVVRGIIETHVDKIMIFTKHFDKFINKLNIQDWVKVIIIPITITLSPTPMTIYRMVPSVSILSLPTFLNEFDGYLENISSYKYDLSTPKIKFKQTKLRKKF